jgi:nucleoside-diphosphate-sugar epimerase
MSLGRKKKILITGGSGVLGEALIKAFPAEKILALCHRQGLGDASAEVVWGSVSRPRLGLDEEAYARVAGGTEAILHCASLTQFVGSGRRVMETNVRGAQHVLALAREARAPIYYVSTAFVHPSCGRPGADNPYIGSKREAERLLKESGHPLTILRPSIVGGDSETGYIPKHQGFHALMRLVIHEALPVLPIDPSSYVDWLPRDVAAKLIAAIVGRRLVGKEYWLTLGRERASSVPQLMGRLRDVVEAMTGKRVAPPKYVSSEMYERLIKPAILPALPLQLVRDYSRLEWLEGYFSLREPLPSSIDELARQGIEVPYSVPGAFDQNVRSLTMREMPHPSAGLGLPRMFAPPVGQSLYA